MEGGDEDSSSSASPELPNRSKSERVSLNRKVWNLPSIREKLKDRLIEAQEALLLQSKERAELYGSSRSLTEYGKDGKQEIPPSPQLSHPHSRRTSNSSQDGLESKRQSVLPVLKRPLSSAGSQSTAGTAGVDHTSASKLSVPSPSFGDESTVSGRARANTLDNLTPTVAGNIRTVLSDIRQAYMGIDWFTVQEKKKKFSLLFFIEELYYWCYAGYIVTVILIGAMFMWLLEPNGAFSLPQALYTSASCVSQSGLAVVDWSKQATSTYVISFILIILGSTSLLHMVPVVLRQNSFRMQAKMSSWQKYNKAGSSDGTTITTFRRYNSDPGVPELFVHHHNHDGHRESAQRWHMPKDESIEEAMKSRKNHCTSHALERSHRLEYKALAKVLKIMAGYWVGVHALGIIIIYCYLCCHGPVQEKFDKEGLRPFPHALYLTVSSFQNNGLVLTQSSVMDYVDSPVLLSTVGALILLGNTGLPIMVRYIAFTWSRRIQPQSEHKRVLDFLLEHPRRCFTHMFPAVHTLWLLLVVVALNILGTVVVLVQDWDSKAFTGLEAGGKMGNALFQTVSTRTAGMNSINIAQLSQGTTFFMAVMMYFSTTPTVVTMRLSAAEHELDITGRVEGVEEAVITAENSLKGQARRYLTQDATYLLVICFLICCLEQDSFARAAKHPSPDSDGIYTDFGFFKVLFEILSAYGTCGLSLGFENQTFSFSGVWCGASQMLLVFTMILGRLRGLPDSIDASVRMAMPSTEEDDANDFVRF